MSRRFHRRTRLGLFFAVAVGGISLVGLAGAVPAFANEPWWHLSSSSAPTDLSPGGEGTVVIGALNVGDSETDGDAVTISDKLPNGLKVQNVAMYAQQFGSVNLGGFLCKQTETVECTFPASVRLDEQVNIYIAVKVEQVVAVGQENEVTIGGGGAPSTSIKRPLIVSDVQTSFGVESYELEPENEGGSLDGQAGSHPFQLTTTLALNQVVEPESRNGIVEAPTAPALPKDLQFHLPPGFIGDPTQVPECTDIEFKTLVGSPDHNDCPADTAIGVVSVTLNEPGVLGLVTARVPLFNLTPNVGEPARFAFEGPHSPVFLNTSVRSGGDYGVTVSVDNITELVSFLSSRVTIWGVPGDPRHDQSRGWECLFGEAGCILLGQERSEPFLTLPTSCHEGKALETSVDADSWAQPDDSLRFGPSEAEESLDGCNQLPFSPSIEVSPDGKAASTSTGLTVGVRVPQEVGLNSEGLAEADVKSTTVALPVGVQLSPSGGNGLRACSDAQIGFTGINPETGTNEFTSGAPSCPDASKIATVKIETPLLPNPLEGAVYLAAPQNFTGLPQNPFESLIAMYIVAEDPVSGVLVKLPGKVLPSPVTGQLVSIFENTPQLPFENLELHFFGGERAPLSSPALCGTYTTQASFTPWSGSAPVTPSSNFDITSGPNGVPCSDPQPFAPGFQAGTTNLQAGAFTPFTLTMTRPDADQTLGGIEMHMPPGFSGVLSSVRLCGEPQALQGTCGAESMIGETVVSAGLGGDPYTVTGGKVYITTAYGGGQYGLSIVNPAAAGPFVLNEGRPIIVRAAIYVDPHTAVLRIVSDPLPTILDGIPLQIQHVNVMINRPGFTFNPTDCDKMAITGTIASSEGASAAVSTSFQVTNCATLAFKPKFTASTSGKTSKANGASLTVKLSYPNTPQGSETNLAKVKVDLPKQLPSRLTTLQKACTAAVFEADPANCPAASIVGHAKAITPIIPVPLEGPAYFVSHGGEAFPSLIMVLQGYGTTIDLVGTTFISKAGITSSTFKAVPDVPVGSFELNLPEERYSALAANGNLCKSKLAMPTAFVGQNGAEIHISTPISVTGCRPALGVVRHSIEGSKATIVVSVPSAGKLTATGKGLSTGKGKAGRAGTVSVKIALTKAERAFLKKHPGRKLKAKINLRFTPKKGPKLATSTTILIA
jgi:hypothetical protein